jgi:hypothetical protein
MQYHAMHYSNKNCIAQNSWQKHGFVVPQSLRTPRRNALVLDTQHGGPVISIHTFSFQFKL